MYRLHPEVSWKVRMPTVGFSRLRVAVKLVLLLNLASFLVRKAYGLPASLRRIFISPSQAGVAVGGNIFGRAYRASLEVESLFSEDIYPIGVKSKATIQDGGNTKHTRDHLSQGTRI